MVEKILSIRASFITNLHKQSRAQAAVREKKLKRCWAELGAAPRRIHPGPNVIRNFGRYTFKHSSDHVFSLTVMDSCIIAAAAAVSE